MFSLKTSHPDWYADEIDGDEALWRLDLTFEGMQCQVQLFAMAYDALDGLAVYEATYLFIERDRRDASGDVRVDYACDSWPLLNVDAVRLLAMSSDEAAVVLQKELLELAALPCDNNYCGTHDEQQRKLSHQWIVNKAKNELADKGRAWFPGTYLHHHVSGGFMTTDGTRYATVEEAVTNIQSKRRPHSTNTLEHPVAMLFDSDILALVPKGDGHRTFNGIVSRFREEQNWEISRFEGESIVQESLTRLRKAGKIRIVNYRDFPLGYSQTGE